MTENVSNLMEPNLLGVFNERDAQRRALATWLGPDGGDPVASGSDVAVVRNDLISEPYTVNTT